MQIDLLEEGVPQLSSKRAEYESVIAAVALLESTCSELRIQSKYFMQDLQQARMALSRIRIKVQAIASDLQACEYAQTRREISKRLKMVVEDIQRGHGRMSYDNNVVNDVMQSLRTVDNSTKHVLRILEC